jgi:hypothetical protein
MKNKISLFRKEVIEESAIDFEMYVPSCFMTVAFITISLLYLYLIL